EIEDDRDFALAVENAACADGGAYALVDTIFERDGNVAGKGLKPADADAAPDVAGAGEGLAPVGGRRDLGRQIVDRDDGLDDLPHHVEIVRIDIGQCEFDIGKFGDLQQVRNQRLGKTDRTGTNNGDLERHMRLTPLAA